METAAFERGLRILELPDSAMVKSFNTFENLSQIIPVSTFNILQGLPDRFSSPPSKTPQG